MKGFIIINLNVCIMYFIINTTLAHASYFRKEYFRIYFVEILNIALLRMYFVSLHH